MPQIPDGREAGLPGLVLESWIGLFAPAHTPQPVIEKLRAAVAKVMQTPDVVKRLETSGIRPLSMAPNDTERFVKAESEKWAQFLRNAGNQGGMNMQTEKQSDVLEALLDRAAIAQVVQDWGISRDAGRWEKLRSFYTSDAIMYTTWFVGPAAEFVERSMEAAKKGARGQHFIGAASIDIKANKAIAETRMILLVRGVLEGVEVDVNCYGRFYDRFVKSDGQWPIQKRMVIYEKDRMDVLDPAVTLQLKREELVKRPEGYRHLAYLQSHGGASITPDLPTPNSPELARLYAEGEAWLGADSVDMQNQPRETL